MVDKKPTKRDNFITLLAILAMVEADDALTAFVEHEIELLDKKRANGTANPKRVAEVNANKSAILAVLADGEPSKATAIAGKVDMTVQRVTALLTQLVKDGEVVREVKGKDTTFRVE